MKKLMALVLSIVLVCCFCVTAFAAESPTATEKIAVTVRKGDLVQPAGKSDVEYTVDKSDTIIVKADEKYGDFKNWAIYKVITTSAGTKAEIAVAGVDYEIVKGSLNDKEIAIKIKSKVVVCGNYGDVITDPLSNSNADSSANAPQTGDTIAVYTAVVMVVATMIFAFGFKKVYLR